MSAPLPPHTSALVDDAGIRHAVNEQCRPEPKRDADGRVLFQAECRALVPYLFPSVRPDVVADCAVCFVNASDR